MQIPQTYKSSEKLDVNSDKYLSKPNQYWSHSDTSKAKMGVTTKSYNELTKTGPSKSYANACDTAKYWANYDKFAKLNIDLPKHLTKDLDASNCAECVENNFWFKKSVLNKNTDEKANG
ncbi:hypothetical protein B5X24_HaOG211222 [Helicoverpa armigera]|uniref:Uncharacterized protein n=1 Tax=Helicoverpa armigera TaxID=29058 RepID=A0A2W1BF93_HELAM|nr:hypothetical protein B5X24_HaOG211222 [Helicoverpa armigera]